MVKQTCDAANVLGRCTMRVMADKAGVTLSVLPYQPGCGSTDRIIQTLTNLLSNAIKFSSEGLQFG